MLKKLSLRLGIILLVCAIAWGGVEFILLAEPDPKTETKRKLPKATDVARATGDGRSTSSATQRSNTPSNSRTSSASQSTISRSPVSAPAQSRNQLDENAGVSPNFSQGSNSDAVDEDEYDKDFIPNELIVLEPSAGFEAAIVKLGYTVIERSELDALGVIFFRIRIPGGISAPDARDDLERRFPALSIDVNHNYQPAQDQRRRLNAPDRPVPHSQTARRGPSDGQGVPSRARALIGWEDLPQTCGAGVKLGMIDSGVDRRHPALKGKDIQVRNVHDPKLRSGSFQHGTAIAALLIGNPADRGWGGLLPGASLRVANIFAVNAEGRTIATSGSLLRGINWLARQKVHAVNIGVTGANNKNVRKAMTIALKKDLVLVAAVGNKGLRKKRAYPAGYYHVVAVTAVGPYRGAMRNSNQGTYVDFAAPGVRLWTAVPGGGLYQSGSSFATTYVTALLASRIARGASRDPDTLRDMISRETEDLGRPGRDNIYGWGLIRGRPIC